MSFQSYELEVAAVEPQTADSAAISFKDDGQIAYIPGQFLTLEVEVDGKKERRSYSLCSLKGLDPLPTVAIKRVKGGKVSNLLLDTLRPGKKVRVFQAIGTFTLAPNPALKRHIVLIGAGSGITPLYSMMKGVLTQEPKSMVSLIYGNRYPESVIFKAGIEDWKGRYPGRLQVVDVMSGQGVMHNGPTGRITGELVTELLHHLKPLEDVDSTEFYMCGPQGMMDSVEKSLIATGVKKGSIHRESFFSDHVAAYEAEHPASTQTTGQDGPSKVTILLDGSTYEIDVPEGQTILETALDADIDMPYSCQSGLCTACRGKCLEGAVEMEETEGLSDSEIAEGYVLTCVGHPKGARVKIEIG